MRLDSRPLPFLLAVAALATILGAAVSMMSAPTTIQADEPETAPTPVATVVTPVVVTVVPVEQVVTPLTGMAEAETTAVEQGAADEGSSSSVFSGVRGGFIGAGIAIGLVMVATVIVRGARVLVRQRRE